MSRLCSLAKKYNSTSSRCPPLCTFCLSCGFLLHAYYTAAGPCNETKNELSYFESKRLPQMQKGGFMGPWQSGAPVHNKAYSRRWPLDGSASRTIIGHSNISSSASEAHRHQPSDARPPALTPGCYYDRDVHPERFSGNRL